MNLVPCQMSALLLREPTTFDLFSQDGSLLAKKGHRFESGRELARLTKDGADVFIRFEDSKAGQEADMREMMLALVSGQANSGDKSRASGSPAGAKGRAVKEFRSAEQIRAELDSEPDWPYLQEQAHTILSQRTNDLFLRQIDRLVDKLMHFSQANPDGTLLVLIHLASKDLERYSANHAVLVCVLCNIAAKEVLLWPDDLRKKLCCAALTMNVGMTALQDQLALQHNPLTELQRESIDLHAHQGAELLESYGLQDKEWIETVRGHHMQPAGPLAQRSQVERFSRLIQRADRFAAAISPRATRKPMSPSLAMKTLYFDEQKQVDEAGAAIIKAVGIYSPGSYVRLGSSETAVVVRRGANTASPLVAVVLNRYNQPHNELTLRDTSVPEFRVLNSLAPQDVGARLNIQRLMALTKTRQTV